MDRNIEKISDREWKVYHNRKEYTITREVGGLLRCQCEEWRYSSKKRCKGTELLTVALRQAEKEENERRQGKLL